MKSLATALQHGVERFAKPWWRSRALRLCRDRTTMAATADLLGTIEAALQASGKLVVILSPAAATSEWVDREVAWWLGHKPPSDLVLVLAEGELEWGDGVWDATSHPVLPPALRELTTEPLWVDLRDTAPGSSQWTERVAEVAAAVRNVPKDLLFGVHRHESRRRVRHLGAVGGVGVVLVVAGLIAALLASERGQLALAGRLAARSTALLGTDLVQAQLLAVRAYRMAPTDETTAALFRAVTATPQAVGYLDAGEPVTAVARARTADVVVAGTESGNVLRWSGGVRTVIGHTDGATNAVSVSDDGAVASMAGGTQARLWVGGRLHAVDLGDDRKAGPTAVSPSGHTALFDAVSTLDLTDGPPQGAIVTVDVPTRAYRSFALPGWWRELHAPADGRVVAAGDTGGWWLGSGDGRVDVAGSVYTGAHAVTSAISTDGRYFSFTNGSPQVPVWDTAPGEADTQQPNRLAAAPPAGAVALAISPDGRRLAASGADGVYVSAIATVSTTAPLTLPGDSFVTALHFVDDNTLVGAAGHAVVTWDLTRVSRIAMDDVPADVPWPCNACPGWRSWYGPTAARSGCSEAGPTASSFATTGPGPARRASRPGGSSPSPTRPGLLTTCSPRSRRTAVPSTPRSMGPTVGWWARGRWRAAQARAS